MFNKEVVGDNEVRLVERIVATDDIGMLWSVVVLEEYNVSVTTVTILISLVIVEDIPVTEGIGSIRNHKQNKEMYKYLLIITETSG